MLGRRRPSLYIAGLVPDPDAPRGFRFEPHIPAEVEEFEVTVPFRGHVWRIAKNAGTAGEVLLEQV